MSSQAIDDRSDRASWIWYKFWYRFARKSRYLFDCLFRLLGVRTINCIATVPIVCANVLVPKLDVAGSSPVARSLYRFRTCTRSSGFGTAFGTGWTDFLIEVPASTASRRTSSLNLSWYPRQTTFTSKSMPILGTQPQKKPAGSSAGFFF